jgi:hypothetical protein
MAVLEMVVIVTAIGCGAGVAIEYFKTKQKNSAASGDELDDALDRIDELEERIRVLERVVTDDKYDLGRQIDQL